MPKVFIWRDGAVETEFDPGHRDWRIGRSETNDITLIDPRKSVSRFHAELREEHGRWVFIDLNSQNGSWKDGQRVNRLILEHGHEVLFGDYKLAFQDLKPAAPPPVPRAPDTAGTTGSRTPPPPVPDQTLLMPGAKSGAAPVVAGPPPPVVRQSVKAKAPRKGVNPIILVVFLLTMLGAVAAVAYRVMTSGGEETTVATTQPPATTPDPPPAVVPPAEEPPAGPVAPATSTTSPEPPVATTTAPAPVTTPVPPPPPPPPPATTTAPPVTNRPPPVSQGGRPKRTPPPPASKDASAVAARYEEGRRALNAGRFVEAERVFQAVLAQQPNFRDTTALLAQARHGQVTAREKALADAQALEASGDWPRAIAAYERAGAADQAAAARTKMQAAGDDAYRKARQFDARNRPAEAITWYGRAVEWLADSDARKATAQERLAALKGGEE
ncbi:MAG TPA: FHA domain-containing protein [Luteitalea sp.]|nr:FHA domain-containing protein [Luteitalea sp.]